jgi:cytochrome c oxidase subunit III
MNVTSENDSLPDKNTLDVSTLPTYAYSHRSLMWWGTWGMMLIEATVFVMAIGSYLFLRSHADQWPMSQLPPDLLWGSVNVAILLISCVPNHWVKQAAEREDLSKVRLWLVVCLLFSLAFIGVRVLEFNHLNTSWDNNAYGSIVWLLLSLHTVHLVTDTIDSALLTVLMFTGPLEGVRFVDVSENAMYWYFVAFTWLPIYAVLYLLPRVLSV